MLVADNFASRVSTPRSVDRAIPKLADARRHSQTLEAFDARFGPERRPLTHQTTPFDASKETQGPVGFPGSAILVSAEKTTHGLVAILPTPAANANLACSSMRAAPWGGATSAAVRPVAHLWRG